MPLLHVFADALHSAPPILLSSIIATLISLQARLPDLSRFCLASSLFCAAQFYGIARHPEQNERSRFITKLIGTCKHAQVSLVQSQMGWQCTGGAIALWAALHKTVQASSSPLPSARSLPSPDERDDCPPALWVAREAALVPLVVAPAAGRQVAKGEQRKGGGGQRRPGRQRKPRPLHNL